MGFEPHAQRKSAGHAYVGEASKDAAFAATISFFFLNLGKFVSLYPSLFPSGSRSPFRSRPPTRTRKAFQKTLKKTYFTRNHVV